MTTKNRITAAAAALAIAGVLAACSQPAPEPTVEPVPTITDTPTQAPEPTVTPDPEPTSEPTPELLPIPDEVIEKAKGLGGEARKTNADMLKQADEIVKLAKETYDATGRKLIFVKEGGSFGWEGELVETFYTYTAAFPELQVDACRDRQSETVKGAIERAEACIALQADPSIYEIVVTI